MEYQAFIANKNIHTQKLHRFTIMDFMRHIGTQDISGVTHQHVQSYINEISKRNKPSTVECRFVRLNCFLKYFDKGVDKRKITLPRKRRTEERFLDENFIGRYYEEVGKIRSLRMKVLLAVLPLVGTRIGEMVGDRTKGTYGLRKRDIILDKGRYKIRITAESGKGSKERTVPLNRKAAALLVPYAAGFENDEDPLFDISDATVRQKVKEIGRRIGAPWLKPHSMRHTFISTLAANRIDIRTIASLVGHSSLKTTFHYTHTSDAVREKAVDEMNFIGKSSLHDGNSESYDSDIGNRRYDTEKP